MLIKCAPAEAKAEEELNLVVRQILAEVRGMPQGLIAQDPDGTVPV